MPSQVLFEATHVLLGFGMMSFASPEIPAMSDTSTCPLSSAALVLSMKCSFDHQAWQGQRLGWQETPL